MMSRVNITAAFMRTGSACRLQLAAKNFIACQFATLARICLSGNARIFIMGRLKLDLHDIYSDGRRIEESLERVIQDAVKKKITEVEIIPGKGSGQLKKSVLRFLEQPRIKQLYHRLEKDDKNFGRIFIHFRY